MFTVLVLACVHPALCFVGRERMNTGYSVCSPPPPPPPHHHTYPQPLQASLTTTQSEKMFLFLLLSSLFRRIHQSQAIDKKKILSSLDIYILR